MGVIISTLLIQFYGWTGFDPIASLFIAVLIAASVIPLVLDTGKVLALDLSNKDTVIHEALAEVSVTKPHDFILMTTLFYPAFVHPRDSFLLGTTILAERCIHYNWLHPYTACSIRLNTGPWWTPL